MEDHSKTFLLLELYCQSTPSCLKVIGWVEEEVILPVEEVIHTLVIIVSAQSKELGFWVS